MSKMDALRARTGVKGPVVFAVLGLLATMAMVPSGASAATIGFSNGALSYTAGTAEENAISVYQIPGNKLEFFENGLGVDVAYPAPRCARRFDPQNPTSVIVDCSAASVNKMAVDVGDLNDSVQLSDNGSLPTAVSLPATIHGGSGADDVTGGTGNDSVFGDTGDDLNVDGSEGQDTLDGGPGTDSITDSGTGLDDSDTIFGGPGGDNDVEPEFIASGDGANDVVDGGSGDDDITLGGENGGGGTALGGVGEDTLTGGTLSSTLDGGSNNDTLTGGDADDKLIGGSGDDVLNADGGIDLMDGGSGKDTFTSGSGVGVVDYSARTNSIIVDTNQEGGDGEANEKDSVGSEVQGILGGSGNDTLTGSDEADNILTGGIGNDTLNGAGGTDVLNGGPGADKLNGGAGEHDTADYSAATGALAVDLDGVVGDDGVAGEGDTVGADVEDVVGGSGTNKLTGNGSDNVLTGADLADILDGQGGNDLLSGYGGADTLTGGEGNDGITGGPGADNMNGGEGLQDYVSYSDHTKAVTVDLDGKLADDGGVEDSKHDTVLGFEGIIGGAANDKLKAGVDDIANSFVGGSGNDMLDGNGGNDVLDGSSGNDKITGDDGDDKIYGGNNKDLVNGGPGGDRFLMNYDFINDRVTCGTGADFVRNKLGHRTTDIGDAADRLSKDCEQAAVPTDDGPTDWWKTPDTLSDVNFDK